MYCFSNQGLGHATLLNIFATLLWNTILVVQNASCLISVCNLLHNTLQVFSRLVWAACAAQLRLCFELFKYPFRDLPNRPFQLAAPITKPGLCLTAIVLGLILRPPRI